METSHTSTSGNDAAPSAGKAGHFLPYPQAAELLAVRHGPQIATVGEFSRVPGKIEQLVATLAKGRHSGYVEERLPAPILAKDFADTTAASCA